MSETVEQSAEFVKDSELRRVLGRRSFEFVMEDDEGAKLPPLRIEVKFLPVDDFVEFFDLVGRLGMAYFTGDTNIWGAMGTSVKEVKALLEPLVSVPSSPNLKLGDLPADVLPGCLKIVMESISPGKWQGLGKFLEERYGLSGIFAKAAEQAQAKAEAEAEAARIAVLLRTSEAS